MYTYVHACIYNVCAYIQGNHFISCLEWVWNGAVKLTMCCVWVLMEEKQTSSPNDTLSTRLDGITSYINTLV